MMSNRDILLQVLTELEPLELKQFQYCLTHKVLKTFVPIPGYHLGSADADSIIKAMLRYYGEEDAVRIMAEIISSFGIVCHSDQFLRHGSPTLFHSQTKWSPKHIPDLIQSLRRELVCRIRHVGLVLCTLLKHGILDEAQSEAVRIYASQREKNRALVDLVLRKGADTLGGFYEALCQCEPLLMEELRAHPAVSKEPLTVPVIRILLGTLVSDELMAFQWYLTQHAMAGHPPVDRQQLVEADSLETEKVLERHYGPEQATMVALQTFQKIIPEQSFVLRGELLSGSAVSTGGAEPTRTERDSAVIPVDMTPEVHKEGNMYRLQCPWAGVFRCSVTGLVFEGDGEVIYWSVAWDRRFLNSKGLKPAGPLFKFTCLSGSFSRLQLPHCQMSSDDSHDALSVAHVTENKVEFIQPNRMTDKYVVINISGFSGFGLVTETGPAAETPINGIVLLFYEACADPDLYASLYVLLLPRNAIIPQVIKEWNRRNGTVYIEALPDCELVPNQTYKLYASPVQNIQPEKAKFINFEEYDNYTASFEVQLAIDAKKVELVLKNQAHPPWLTRWLFGPYESEVWSRVIKFKGAPPPYVIEESCEMRDVLLNILSALKEDQLRIFQKHLSLLEDPIHVCVLETADRMTTVERMVQKYLARGAKDITVDILKKMEFIQLAEDLQRR
ncbi:uncharacterized protein LOC130110698 [Lampris incognitus]|uniref:uncharacterized protein LOC130110698 n=1 Tax=Lampris incognitus TaxID=2546036 RepID=UPI0024B4D49C|nr:uncharacterized protein LOC130110698 [Lampris incognitus]